MIFFKQCYALYAIIQGEVAALATVPALLELDSRSFCNLSPGRVCDFYCCCVYYYTVHYLPLKQIKAQIKHREGDSDVCIKFGVSQRMKL